MDETRTQGDLGRFFELARDFHAAAERGDTAAQERILAQRRRLMPALGRAPEPQTSAEREERERTLRAILEIDRDSEAILERARDELGGKLLSGLGATRTRRLRRGVPERGQVH